MDYSVLKALADQIANEKADEANSAIRIGGWMQNLLLWLSVQLRGKSDGVVAGAIFPWPGIAAPAGYALIPKVQSNDYSMADYAALYANLGGANTPWGQDLVTSTFSLPWCPEGHTFIMAGDTYVLAQTGGDDTVTLDLENVPNHKHPTSEYAGKDGGGPHITADPLPAPGNNLAGNYTGAAGGKADGTTKPFDIQNPYLAVNWIIKLTNENNSFTFAINANGHLILTYSNGITEDAGLVVGPKGDKGDQGISSLYIHFDGNMGYVDFLDPNLRPVLRAHSNDRQLIDASGRVILFADSNTVELYDPTSLFLRTDVDFHGMYDPASHPAFVATSAGRQIRYPNGNYGFTLDADEVIINSPTGSRALYADTSHLLICDENNIGAFYANANVRIFGDSYGATAFQINVDSRRIMTPSGNNAVYSDNNGIILYATDQVFAINITDEIMFNSKEEHNSDVIFWGLVEYDNDETHNGYSTFYGGADFQCEADFDSDVYFNGLVNMGSLFVLSPIPNPTGGYDGQIAFTGSAFKGRINGVWKTFQMV